MKIREYFNFKILLYVLLDILLINAAAFFALFVRFEFSFSEFMRQGYWSVIQTIWIPGTLICGWLSDRLFNGRRALPTIIFMALVAGFICLYWLFIDNLTVVTVSLIGIGFFIYGPVMLIGVQALDLAPKNAAGTAAGLTGFFGYFFGTAILANTLIGYVSDHFGWNMTFVLLLIACALSIVFMAVTYKEEQYLAERNKSHQS